MNNIQLYIQTQEVFIWNFQTCYYVFHQQINDSFWGLSWLLEDVTSESGH